MIFAVCTIFPPLLPAFCSFGVLGKAVEKGIIRVETIDPRDFTHDRHKTTDDRPFGGGSGMVMKPEPLQAAIRQAKQMLPEAPVILLGPQGRVFTQAMARRLAAGPGCILVCGRYEGVDERVLQTCVDEEISVGDYVLSGGEPAALVVMDAVARLVPGVLGNAGSPETESFEDGLLEHGHYTRPRVFEDEPVPEVLLNGHHKDIATWREETALLRTLVRRLDLLEKEELTGRQIAILKDWGRRIDTIVSSQSVPGPAAPSGDE